VADKAMMKKQKKTLRFCYTHVTSSARASDNAILSTLAPDSSKLSEGNDDIRFLVFYLELEMEMEKKANDGETVCRVMNDNLLKSIISHKRAKGAKKELLLLVDFRRYRLFHHGVQHTDSFQDEHEEVVSKFQVESRERFRKVIGCIGKYIGWILLGLILFSAISLLAESLYEFRFGKVTVSIAIIFFVCWMISLCDIECI
jgi:hypothetical protein